MQQNEDRRYGVKSHGDKIFFLCSNSRTTKTSTLFREKIGFLVYTLPSMERFREEVRNHTINEEREKYSRIVHNLKTLNAQSILSQYKFIPQDVFADNYANLLDYVISEIKTHPKNAAIALIRQAKNNIDMQTEFSTHEKLSIENPNLAPRVHNIRKVILNVYHAFNIDFRDRKVTFRITDSDYKAKFDYDTIRVAIYHLFSNAIKYIAENSVLNVKIEQEGHYAVVDFHMKSFFIFPDEVESIFNDHSSGRVAKSRLLSGSGLGMGLIRKALALNDASIEIVPGDKKIKIGNTDYGDNVFRFKFHLKE